MAPAVPFALLGVVQLVAIAGWVGLAGAALFPRLRRRTTPLFVLGALVLAAADAAVAIDFGDPTSDAVAWLRVAGLVLVGIGAAGGATQTLAFQLPAAATAGVVVPLGAAPSPAYVGGVAGVLAAGAAWQRSRRPNADRAVGAALAAALLLTGVAAALADPARTSSSWVVAQLVVRAAATAAVALTLALLARTMLLGKLAGAILVGVVVMAAGAVGVVGTGVANEVQNQQSARLLQVAQSERDVLVDTVGPRALVFAQVVAQCPTQQRNCVQFLHVFSDQASYFAVEAYPGGAREVATNAAHPLSDAALTQLAGSSIVQAAMRAGSGPNTSAGGVVLLPGSPPTLAVVEAVPGRPASAGNDARVKPTFAAVYGVFIGNDYLSSVAAVQHYDFSVVADGAVLASNLPAAARDQVLHAARASAVDSADASSTPVVAASGRAPTVAFVAIPQAGNDDVRLATLAVSQPADEALRAQRSVLQRMFGTALVAMLLVVGLALLLARRIADPVRRLTVAAGRVRRGDLDTTTSVWGRDEVGSLARAFDAMTASLRTATGDLRAAAEQEAALRARMETVVESMSDGLVVTDAKDRVTAVNATAARLLAVDADEVIGCAVDDVLTVIDGDGRPMLDGADDGVHDGVHDGVRDGVRDSRDSRVVDGVVKAADGTAVPVRVGVAPLADRQGRVIVLADRTREYEVERMKTEFLANVSHELRTPLTPIRGYAELLARRTDLARPQVDMFLGEILGSTARMSRVVELLVDVAALEGNRVAVDISKITVRALVDDRLAAWRERYPERAGDLRRRVATKLPALAIDARWVKRALDELVDNAVKYTPAKTPITVVAAAAEEPGWVRLSVRDAGPGFDATTAAELVGDFAQADASETRRVGGLGLGLGFVNRVTDRFGLGLEVDATPGKGAEFTLLLPVWTGDAANDR